MPSRHLNWFAFFAALSLAAGRAPAMECDCAAAGYCTNNADLADELDRRLRAHLTAGRRAEEIYQLEGGDSILRPRSERWADEHPQAARPERARLKYRGAGLPEFFGFSCIDSSVKLAGICIGADKLGHFFQQGWEGYVIAERDQRGVEAAKSYAEWLEGVGERKGYSAKEDYFRRQPSGRIAGYGGFGRNISGVISHADVAASCAGTRFYHDVAAGKFKTIRDYVSRDWCEENNRNDYTPAMWKFVRQNTAGREHPPNTPAQSKP